RGQRGGDLSGSGQQRVEDGLVLGPGLEQVVQRITGRGEPAELLGVVGEALGGHGPGRVDGGEGGVDAGAGLVGIGGPGGPVERPARGRGTCAEGAAGTTEPTPTGVAWKLPASPRAPAAISSRWLIACSMPDAGAVDPATPIPIPLRVRMRASSASR